MLLDKFVGSLPTKCVDGYCWEGAMYMDGVEPTLVVHSITVRDLHVSICLWCEVISGMRSSGYWLLDKAIEHSAVSAVWPKIGLGAKRVEACSGKVYTLKRVVQQSHWLYLYLSTLYMCISYSCTRTCTLGSLTR